MANWEFENDSTTNYLRVQDEVAQNPIDFHENGTVESSAVNTKNTNGILTPTDNTLQAIQDLVDSNKYAYIKLRPGVLYEGNTQLVLNTLANGGGGKVIYIDAYGAGINYTGSKKEAVRIYHDTPTSGASGTGRVTVHYGSWWGPGKGVTNSAVIRIDDKFGTEVRPSEMNGAVHGILAVNNTEWNEGSHYGKFRQGFYWGGDAPSMGNPDYVVRAAGGGSSFPDAGGTASFRNTDITLPWAGAADGGITFWQDHGSHHGADCVIRGFLPSGGTHYRMEEIGGATQRYMRLYFESEGGNSNTNAMEIADPNPPVLIAPRIGSVGNGIVTEGVGSYPVEITNTGRRGAFEVRLHEDYGFNNTWFKAIDPSDGSQLYKITNRKDNFTLKANNDAPVMAMDSNNARSAFQGSEFQAQDPNGTSRRRFKGAFANHPSASNGDVWFIDGSGTPTEGFYGQTSGGVVQIA